MVTSSSRGRSIKSGPKGQSLVEFALVLPILIMIMVGVLDLARIYFVYIAIEDSTSEGATFLTLSPNCTDENGADNNSPTECADPNNALFRIENATGGILDWDNVEYVTAIVTGEGDYGDIITVQLEYKYHFLAPYIPEIVGINPIVITSRTIQVVAPLAN